MGSLRTRLLVCVLALSAAGLVALAVVTYAEQRSFLIDRVDQQLHGSVGDIAHQLDAKGFHAGGHAPAGSAGSSRAEAPPRDLNLPPGTFGQRRSATGRVLGHYVISYSSSTAPLPELPATLPLNRVVTVGSVGSSGLRYRALAVQDPHDAGITVIAVPLREADQTLASLRRVEILVVGAVLLALAASALFVIRLGLRPLERMAVTAGEIAAGRLSRRVEPATSRTEVGRLGLALNAMLGRLEHAFAKRQSSEDRLRHFLADASHELRTPLASIRGYAELFRMGAASDPAALETAMARIEDEAKRMGVLVEDLLTLARLDELRDPVREPVDVSELAANAVHDARVTAPDRAIALHAAGDHAVTIGDADQLHQVIANLMRNALVHTPAGTPIDVTVANGGGDVRIEVRDHGAGLPAVAPERLFERFWRAEGGRERGRDGAGLGLAIVGGIVDAHGGTVAAANATGGGARFVVSLPGSPVPRRRAVAGIGAPAGSS